MNKEEMIKAWDTFTQGNDFVLNPDAKLVESVADGVLENEKKYGLKYCPCRLVTGDFDKDAELVCPCNFKIQEKWQNKGECWCGLFVRK